ncbi:MAG TPA: lipid kinase [Azospirillaceae bacterium]|nr:lipid kinase [Azospirillaceae bacterium]
MPQASPARPPQAGAQRRCLLIVNPRARGGGGDADAIAGVMRENGLVVQYASAGGRDEMAATIRAHAGAVDLVVVGGGDGTLNAALPGLIDTGLPLGILPLGTANDLARTLGIPADPLEAARIAATADPRPVDVGEVNGVHFFNVASIGLSVDLARELTREMKARWGVLGYAIAGFRVLKRLRPFRADIRIGGVVHRVKSVQVGIGNGRHYGGGMTVEEDAAVDDGRLDVYSIDVRGWWELPLLYPAFRSGRHGRWENVHVWDCTEVEVATRRPLPVNTDGELTTATPARFRVLPGAVRIACPPRPGAPPCPGAVPRGGTVGGHG